MASKKLQICGIRGIPAKHGGFETFAERLALYLAQREWEVIVYCQVEATQPAREYMWNDIYLVDVPVRGSGPLSTILFDLKCVFRSLKRRSTVLTLGYNTAVFSLLYRLSGLQNIINMDGLEWQREKWKLPARIWLYLNERAGCWVGNHLIADHPSIEDHLSTRVSRNKITMIPYGADFVDNAPVSVIQDFGLESNGFSLVIARPEPENLILEIVKAFSSRKRGSKLVVLGEFDIRNNKYHRQVLDAASEEVVFLGAIYDKTIVTALRYHTRLYIHGHTVGGTNPSLVEAMGAGSPVLAHDNRFNRWVAGDSQRYFSNEESCDRELTALLSDREQLDMMAESARQRYRQNFTWEQVLQQYEQLLLKAAD